MWWMKHQRSAGSISWTILLHIMALAPTMQGTEHLERIKRFDMPGFVPPTAYIREMKRYGVLPSEMPEGTALDVYQTDRRYWQSLWYTPPK
jgi:hypothetical protein